MGLKATVRNGRLQMDLPVDLPDGTEFEFVLDDSEGTSMSGDEIRRLNAAIQRAVDSLDAGRGVDGEVVIDRLRALRR